MQARILNPIGVLDSILAINLIYQSLDKRGVITTEVPTHKESSSECATNLGSHGHGGDCSGVTRQDGGVTPFPNEGSRPLCPPLPKFTAPENSIYSWLDREGFHDPIKVCCEIVEVEPPERAGYWNPPFPGSVTLGDIKTMDGQSIELTKTEHERITLEAHQEYFGK